MTASGQGLLFFNMTLHIKDKQVIPRMLLAGLNQEVEVQRGLGQNRGIGTTIPLVLDIKGGSSNVGK